MAPPSDNPDDARWMRAALSLARRGLGRVAPNPAVGCVLVRDGRVVGRGWTQPGGRPHAETEALARAGAAARGATAYVTLEPCSHFGQTGPCADALIAAGISRAVVAMPDPDSRVSGRGVDRMRAAGITVDTGLLEADAARLNAGFLSHRLRGRPVVTLKLATTLDGKIATAAGESQWITGTEARADAHLLRMTHDAVLVGIGTALADNPALTCRLPGAPGEGWRVVLDSMGRLPPDAALCDGTRPTLQLVASDASEDAPGGVERIVVPRSSGGGLDPASCLTALADKGVTRLMVEGGGAVAASFLRDGLVDRIVWYRAPFALGGDGRDGIAPIGLVRLSDARQFLSVASRALGRDRVEVLETGDYAAWRDWGPSAR
ncbi:bifunctional diaminohydroxyphosphoribosylaminopyrimidine deaminase/5-amino-6-(5-phosphoribosylamino)uracil reductase RibD [Pacificispira sp.]|uniref:bifunctional diaminohydroxyphosphoribosylaminopyrimidine deaminase/5-amino-6-(5-phosphoribosylamino)uracil reductase RibD n=1 Tax=Pacificispira sp. TaxID=2888761 RepID=UPI003B51B3B6